VYEGFLSSKFPQNPGGLQKREKEIGDTIAEKLVV
jgi:hypothetical protein